MNHLSDHHIIGCLKTYYDIEAIKLTVLPLGADLNASVFKAQTQNQLSYFVKIKHEISPDININILELLEKNKIQHIITPVKTINGHSTQRSENNTFIVYPFIDGENGFSRSLSDEQWLVLGKTLRQIHEINIPDALKQNIRRESYSCTWRDNLRNILSQIDKPFSQKITVEFVAFINKRLKIIQKLLDSAEQLAQKLQKKPTKYVLCHADLHAGNIVISNTNNFYIVDWDAPIMAPKERDLMFIGGGVGNIWNKPREEELFYAGYLNTEVNNKILAYYRHERIVEDIAEYSDSILFTTIDEQSKQEMYKHFIAMFEPDGVVDIAFRTML